MSLHPALAADLIVEALDEIEEHPEHKAFLTNTIRNIARDLKTPSRVTRRG